MAELLEEQSDDKGEHRSEHPAVQPLCSIDVSESLVDIGSQLGDLLFDLVVKAGDVLLTQVAALQRAG